MHNLLSKREYKITAASDRQIELGFARKTFTISPCLYYLGLYLIDKKIITNNLSAPRDFLNL